MTPGTTNRTIHHQVRLPMATAFEIVMQGIRIRLGRSLVTLLGVVLGIAFLMSILTGEGIKDGVARETELRTELRRMESFLVSETGPLRERTVAVLALGPLRESEQRLLARLAEATGTPLSWAGVAPPEGLLPAASLRPVPLASLAAGAVAVVIAGDGKLPAGVEPVTLLADARQKVLAITRHELQLAVPDGVTLVALERELRPEELAALDRERERAAFRTGWIVVISLLVTVIGISNAMLMSVTERFREIGTMKCLGALSSFIRTMFFLEASLLGIVGSVAGGLFGFGFACAAYTVTFGGGLVFAALNLVQLLGWYALSVAAGVVLSVVAAIYPARFAARMVPATALRSTI